MRQKSFFENEKPEAEKRRRSTGIEWTEHTWNPFVGCSIKSAGCKNCYAMLLAARLEKMGQEKYSELTKQVAGRPVWTGVVKKSGPAAFNKPLKIKSPSIIFVNSMSDFFHANVRDEWRLEAIELMRKTAHQYQVLTKRPEDIAGFLERTKIKLPDNFWLGTTVEGAKVRERIDMIRDLPAKVRFLSVEPLIESLGPVSLKGIHWVITGGESGPGARPCNAEWIREVRDQCIEQGVPHFFKQWGISKNNPLYPEVDSIGKGGSMIDGKYFKEMPAGFAVANYEEGMSWE